VADGAVEGKLPHHQGAVQVLGELPGGHEHAQGHGQVVGRPLLAQVGGSQVDGYLLVAGEEAAGVAHGGADALSGLLHAGDGCR
jgi:hypothetical protein